MRRRLCAWCGVELPLGLRVLAVLLGMGRRCVGGGVVVRSDGTLFGQLCKGVEGACWLIQVQLFGV